jgi:hypothetical protein
VGGACSANGEEEKRVYFIGGKQEGERPLGRLRHGYVDNIKMDLIQTVWGGVNSIGLAQDRYSWRALVKAVMNMRVQ